MFIPPKDDMMLWIAGSHGVIDDVKMIKMMSIDILEPSRIILSTTFDWKKGLTHILNLDLC